jgi:hypothetical protein
MRPRVLLVERAASIERWAWRPAAGAAIITDPKLGRQTVMSFAAFLLLVPRAAIACSPALRLDQYAERAAFYAAIERPAYGPWALSVVAALVWLLIARRRLGSLSWVRWLAVLLLGLAIFQPAWWMDSMRGDCGMARNLNALGVAVLSVFLVSAGAWWLRITGSHVPKG